MDREPKKKVIAELVLNMTRTREYQISVSRVINVNIKRDLYELNT